MHENERPEVDPAQQKAVNEAVDRLVDFVKKDFQEHAIHPVNAVNVVLNAQCELMAMCLRAVHLAGMPKEEMQKLLKEIIPIGIDLLGNRIMQYPELDGLGVSAKIQHDPSCPVSIAQKTMEKL